MRQRHRCGVGCERHDISTLRVRRGCARGLFLRLFRQLTHSAGRGRWIEHAGAVDTGNPRRLREDPPRHGRHVVLCRHRGRVTRFCRGEIDIADASRPVRPVEREACAAAGVEFVELPIAYDALSVIVNPGNTWAGSITVPELRKLWEPAAEGKITRWNQVRSGWPDRPIKLFAPGTESGTFDYFTEVVTGTVDASRKDYSASGDDQVIVRGVAADVEALGYVGYSAVDQNRTATKAVAIDDGDDSVGRGPISPSPEAVGRGVYQPFSRPLFVWPTRRGSTAGGQGVPRHVSAQGRRAGCQRRRGPLTGNSYQLAMHA